MLLIINADDFGMTSAVNAAVYQAYQAGRLRSTSLIPGWPAVAEAVEMARQCPDLGVGLHLDLDEGLGFDRDGFYGRSLSNVNAARYQAILADPATLEHRITAQFEMFQATGLTITHVDSHHNVHLLPGIFEQVLAIASRYGVRRMRFRPHFYEHQAELISRHQALLHSHGCQIPTHFRNLSDPQALHALPAEPTEVMAHLSLDPQHWSFDQTRRLLSTETGLHLSSPDVTLGSYRDL